MKLNQRGLILSRRFVIFSLGQALLIFLAIFLSIQYYGHEARNQKESAALILTMSRESPGWPSDMASGLQAACDSLGYNLYIEENVNIAGGQLPDVTDKLVQKGVKHIVLINPIYHNELSAMAHRYPRVNFYNNTIGGTLSTDLFNYSVRYYEIRYIAGVLAALHSQTGNIGYIAPFPSPYTRRDLNAFALGVQSVRPEAKVLVRWTEHWVDPEREKEAIYLLRHRGVDVLTYFLASQNTAIEAQRQELDYIDFHQAGFNLPSHCLAAMETDWQRIYTELLRKSSNKQERHLYWQGMLDKVIDLHLARNLSPRETALTLRAKQKIFQGYPVFSGHIEDKNGLIHCREGEVISANSLLNQMDWLVKGVEIIESK
ncbi:MAG: BMP family ABC transporter substrate-binding protein [Selenomonas ruminantium]|nr:BMP family ABC transporter substrate-binding protein [Selenomonas ruminantium]